MGGKIKSTYVLAITLCFTVGSTQARESHWQMNDRPLNLVPLSTAEVQAISSKMFQPNRNPAFTRYEDVLDVAPNFGQKAKIPRTPVPNYPLEVELKLDDKPYCENFNYLQAGFDPGAPVISDPERRKYWNGEEGEKVISKLNAINKARNTAWRAYKKARQQDNQQAIAEAQAEYTAYRKVYYACVAFSKSGSEWTKSNPKQWRAPATSGAFGLADLDWKNEESFANGQKVALGTCANAWNKGGFQPKLDSAKIAEDSNYAMDVATKVDQGFNTFCAVNLDHQKFAAQKSESCFNPFAVEDTASVSFLHKTDSREAFLNCAESLILERNGKSFTEVVKSLKTPVGGRAVASSRSR